MSEIAHCTPNQLGRLIARRLETIQRRVSNARFETAKAGAKVVKDRTPKAFGELANSVQAFERGSNGQPVIAVDAPHAAAVEVGSAPHTPNLEKLIAWVKLRGLQGLQSPRSLRGSTTRDQASKIRELLRSEEHRGTGGQFSPIDAPEKVARAIAKGIEEHGTKPHWFVRGSLPEIAEDLNRRVRRALKK